MPFHSKEHRMAAMGRKKSMMDLMKPSDEEMNEGAPSLMEKGDAGANEVEKEVAEAGEAVPLGDVVAQLEEIAAVAPSAHQERLAKVIEELKAISDMEVEEETPESEIPASEEKEEV